MRSYPYIKDLFTNVLSKSKAIKGRLFLCPKMGTEINSDELGKLIDDLVIPARLEKKYPLALLMPPVSYGFYTDRKGEWETYRMMMCFLTTTYYSGTNQVMNPNPSTNTSTHTIPSDWHDMKRAAVNFIYVLNRFTKEQGLINTAFRLEQQREKIFTPVSEVGVDRASGVRLEFLASVLIGCELEDYDETDICSIEVPEKDSHPEHQL
jgi:hypothetical protein